MKDNDHNEPIEAACNIAKVAAAETILRLNLTVTAEALSRELKATVKARFMEALADAKAALDCGMRQAAEQTFKASMMLAGVDAAKQAALEHQASETR